MSKGAIPGGAQPPDYKSADVAKPDLPGIAGRVAAGYLTFPAEPPSAAPGKPGKGGTITSMMFTNQAAMLGVDKNPFWQELNKRLGTELRINSFPHADYTAKLTTTLAGGDLPDTVQLSLQGVPNFQQMMKSQFRDLSPYLSGSAAADYPYLAALPTVSFRSMIFNDGLWGVPYPLQLVPNVVMARQDIVGAKGLSLELRDGQDFMKLCKELTDAKNQQWAFTYPESMLEFICEMTGAPNGWRVEDGKFTSAYETDEYRDALGFMAQLWKQGVVWPDTFAGNPKYLELFVKGTTAFVHDNYTDWSYYLANAPKAKISGVVPVKWGGGGQAGVYETNGIYTFTAVNKKLSDDRVREILAVMNWIAAPFGTDVYEFVNYGVPGRDYTLKGTDPVRTDLGNTEVFQMNLFFLANSTPVLFFSGQPEVTRQVYAFIKELTKITIPLPTVGLLSDASSSSAATVADKTRDNLIKDVIQGRKSMKDFDAGVESWLGAVGEKIRKEYEEGYAAANS
jgi:putative aldouronate transport system substrate-binding protein